MKEFPLFSGRLKKARVKKGITKAELARIIGATPTTLSAYETGHSKTPSLDIITNISNVLQVSVDYLLGIDKQEKFEIYSTKEKAYKSLITALTNLPVELEKNNDEYNGTIKLVFSGGTTNFLEDYFGLRPLLLDTSYPDFVKQGAIKSLLDMHSNWDAEEAFKYAELESEEMGEDSNH